MAVFDVSTPIARKSVDFGFFGRILASLKAARRTRDERRILINLSRLDRRVLDDMGFDADAIYEAVDGTWNDATDLRTPRLPKV